MYKSLFLSFLVVALAAPLWSYAQSSDALILTLEPVMPEVGETFTVKAAVQGTTQRSSIQWFANGIELTEYEGLNTIEQKAKDATTVISARVGLTNGVRLEAKKTIAPTRVDLYVQSQSLVPSFYEGRKLPTSGSVMRVNALVFKNNTHTQSGLSYLWKVNNKIQNGGTLQGKSFIEVTPSFEDEVLVSVEVYNSARQLVAQESELIPVASPELHFYENNPLRGLSTVTLFDPQLFISDEMNIRAEAYYLNDNITREQLFTQWKIDGRTANASSEDGQEITIRKEGNAGSSVLSFRIADLKQLLHEAQKSVTLRF